MAAWCGATVCCYLLYLLQCGVACLRTGSCVPLVACLVSADTVLPCLLLGWAGVEVEVGCAVCGMGHVAGGCEGEPCIYDPATYYGHHEAEWGMSWCRPRPCASSSSSLLARVPCEARGACFLGTKLRRLECKLTYRRVQVPV